MKKHEHPDISFLEVDLRLVGPMISVLAGTLLFTQQPGLIFPGALCLIFLMLKRRKQRLILFISLVFLLFQTGNIYVRDINDYFSAQEQTWAVEIVGESGISGTYLAAIEPEKKGAFQQPITAKIKLKNQQANIGDTGYLDGKLSYDKFGFSLKKPVNIRLHQSDSPQFHAHQKIRDALKGRASNTDLGLFLGITYGDDSLIEKDDKDNFRAVGITHMTAVSGSNIAMVASATFVILAVLLKRRRPSLVGTILVTVSYCAFVGLDGSVIRACIFALIGFFAAVTGSTKNTVALCCSAVILMIIFQPLLLWNIGFVLSASVTLGLVIICPPLTFLLTHKCGELLAVFLSANIVAHLVSTPISAFYFGKIYTYSFLANLLVAPLVPIILALGIGYLFVYIFYGLSIDLFITIAHPLLFLIEKLSSYLSQLSGSILEVHNFATLMILILGSLVTSCIIVNSGRRSAAQTPEPVILI